MRVLHCTWALLLLVASPVLAQQPAGAAGADATTYNIFIGGNPAGTEQVRVRSDATGITIASEGRLTPANATLRAGEIRYTSDWTPVSFTAEGTLGGADYSLRTDFKEGSAVTSGTQAGTPVARAQPVSPKPIIVANVMFGAYAALARRLATDPPGTEIRAYVVPQIEIGIRVTAVEQEEIQVGTRVFPVRHYELTLAQPNGDLSVTLIATTSGDLVRMSVPAQGLEVVRSDVASPTSRSQVVSNPGDEAVVIPAAGFSLGATLTRPANTAATAKLPAVILLAGSGVGDRDGTAAGVPTLANLAGALANAGFLAVRYDKRGYGQSGGRAESATLADFAEDARVVFKWLEKRRDVDAKRIAILGHSEGAMVAMIAAGREKKLAAVVSIAGPGNTGAELILEQQQVALATAPAAERDAKVALQKQIQTAVVTGKGWEGVPADLRREADTPWFQSLLTYDPLKAVDDVRQPLLIVHGELDRQVPVSHADRLATLAKQEGKSKVVEVVIVRGVNHLLVPATTGAVSEYGTLADRTVSRDVTTAIAGWLTRTLPATR